MVFLEYSKMDLWSFIYNKSQCTKVWILAHNMYEVNPLLASLMRRYAYWGNDEIVYLLDTVRVCTKSNGMVNWDYVAYRFSTRSRYYCKSFYTNNLKKRLTSSLATYTRESGECMRTRYAPKHTTGYLKSAPPTVPQVGKLSESEVADMVNQLMMILGGN